MGSNARTTNYGTANETPYITAGNGTLLVEVQFMRECLRKWSWTVTLSELNFSLHAAFPGGSVVASGYQMAAFVCQSCVHGP